MSISEAKKKKGQRSRTQYNRNKDCNDEDENIRVRLFNRQKWEDARVMLHHFAFLSKKSKQRLQAPLLRAVPNARIVVEIFLIIPSVLRMRWCPAFRIP